MIEKHDDLLPICPKTIMEVEEGIIYATHAAFIAGALRKILPSMQGHPINAVELEGDVRKAQFALEAYEKWEDEYYRRREGTSFQRLRAPER